MISGPIFKGLRVAIAFSAGTLAPASPALAQSLRPLEVLVCGAGSPRFDPLRGPSCLIVKAGNQTFLFDAGDGASQRMQALQIAPSTLRAVFITHLHSDHVAGLGQVINTSWILGRTKPLEVYGPTGVAELVGGFAQVFKSDTRFRSEHQATLSASTAGALAHPIFLPRVSMANSSKAIAPDAQLVFAEGAVKVFAFRVEHPPVDPAYGYRIEYGGRVIVVSGDTRPSEQIVRNAQDADLLVHEAMDAEAVGKGARAADAAGLAAIAARFRAVLSYHSDVIQVGRLAQRARVKQLLLTHIIPPLATEEQSAAFAARAAEAFHGRITVAVDGTKVILEPNDMEGSRK